MLFILFTVVKITPNQSESSILPVHEINNPTYYAAGIWCNILSSVLWQVLERAGFYIFALMPNKEPPSVDTFMYPASVHASLNMELSSNVSGGNNHSRECPIWRVISLRVIGFFFMWTASQVSVCRFEHMRKFPLVLVYFFYFSASVCTCQCSKSLSELCVHVIDWPTCRYWSKHASFAVCDRLPGRPCVQHMGLSRIWK